MLTTFLILITLVALQLKHFYIDFVNQNNDEIKHKGIYGNWKGMKHSAKHGLWTCVLMFAISSYLDYAFVLGVLDFFLHYHTDWIKSKYGEKNASDKTFWAHFGLDQLVHQLTYILIAASLTLL